jgi:hypothetical protein
MCRTTPLKAIRSKCIDCTNNSRLEIRECPITDCPIYPYRFGKNPARSGIGQRNGLIGQKLSAQQRVSEGKGGSGTSYGK